MTWSHVYRDHWGTHVMAMESLAEHARARHRGDLDRRAHRGRAARAAPGLDGRARPRRAGPQLRVAHALGPHPPGPRHRRARGCRARAADAARRRRGARRGLVRDADDSTEPGVDRRAQPRRARLGRAVAGSARTSRTSPSGRCAASACPPATSPATSPPSGTPPSARRARARATPGSSSGTTAGSRCDPTNGVGSACDHVVVARGRDYEDVPPFKGIYSGARRLHPHGRGAFHPAALTRIPWWLP